nr:Uma2 family endonuclease [Anthocerotibacter panamensis]
MFGRPKGKRGSYQQWQEENIPPQVVFEILSPSNTLKEMAKKLTFYNRYGVEEYYLYDPEKNDFSGWLRVENSLEIIEEIEGWVSPRLGIRFVVTSDTLELYRPDDEKFLSPVELAQRAERSEQRAERLAAKLRELGLDPEQI